MLIMMFSVAFIAFSLMTHQKQQISEKNVISHISRLYMGLQWPRGIILSTTMNAAMLEVFLLQQCNVVNLCGRVC